MSCQEEEEADFEEEETPEVVGAYNWSGNKFEGAVATKGIGGADNGSDGGEQIPLTFHHQLGFPPAIMGCTGEEFWNAPLFMTAIDSSYSWEKKNSALSCSPAELSFD